VSARTVPPPVHCRSDTLPARRHGAPGEGTLSAVPSDPAPTLTEDPPLTRPSRVATVAVVVGVLAIPFGLLVYPGLLLGLVAVGCGAAGLVVTRKGQRPGRGRAAAGLVAGLVALTIAGSLGWQGLRTIRDCEDRVGHKPVQSEIEQCIRDGL
jgi:hypothetical protein